MVVTLDQQYGHTCSKSMDQLGTVANPARGQLNRESEHFPVRVRASESRAYLRNSPRVPRRRPLIYLKPPYAIGSVPRLSGHAIAYRWRLLPRVRRHRASKPQGSSERVLPWQVTMGQLICASLSHTHYWYEVGMLKVPAEHNVGEKPTVILYIDRHVGTPDKNKDKRHDEPGLQLSFAEGGQT